MSVWRTYVVPAGVLQSLMVGGGYGTGREIVEYFSRFGFTGGLLGLALVLICLGVLLAVSYEFARLYRAYDYRRFAQALLGRFWIAFEVIYLAMLALVLAVVAAASGSLMERYLHVPGPVGIAALLLLLLIFASFGRTWVSGILTYKALLLCAVLLTYFVILLSRSGRDIAVQFARHEILAGWAAAAARYLLYSSVVIPTMLFATTAIATLRQALVCAMVSSAFALMPAALLHVSFGADYPEVLSQSIPLYWMVSNLGLRALTVAYLLVLFSSLFDVGLGFIQSVNERLDGWLRDRSGRGITRTTRAAVALACTSVSGALSLVGIVPLIARGYGAMAYAFLALFVAPLLTVGVYRVGLRQRWSAYAPA